MRIMITASLLVALCTSSAACGQGANDRLPPGDDDPGRGDDVVGDGRGGDVAPDRERRGGSNTRSPQGIDDDGRARRDRARGRGGRNELERRVVGGREVRSYDGTDNNEANPVWGAAFEHLRRLAEADYGDGLSTPAGASRPDARTISNLVSHQGETESIPNAFGTSDFLWQWGQFIDHDMDLTDGSDAESIDIAVPRGDLYFDPAATGSVRISVNRALYDPDTGIDGPREQENEITAWIDASMVYGSDDERAAALRAGGDSPFLATGGDGLLPLNAAGLPNASGFVADPATLFLAGDVRANEQIGLTVMHTLLVREHNRIATMLTRQRPGASAEEIFQAARRLVIAEIQIITYEEYLPALLGAQTVPAYAGYDANVQPGIYNEFSVAAYRLGHSELSANFLRLGADGVEIADGHLALRDAFFSAPALLRRADDIDPLLRGFAGQRHQAIDPKVVSDLRNFLFGEPGMGGFDLVALNIQRGRDHGVRSYNDTRAAMGLTRAGDFADISDDAEVRAALRSAYASVDDIDLWVGGLAETPLSGRGSQLGELFTAIVVRQFDELRAADRFWHERDLSAEELAFVEGVTLARLIRNNTNIGDELQDDVFFVAP